MVDGLGLGCLYGIDEGRIDDGEKEVGSNDNSALGLFDGLRLDCLVGFSDGFEDGLTPG